MSEKERPPRDEILRGCIEQSTAEAEKEYKDLRKITEGISKKRLTKLCDKEREEREEKVLNAMADILRFIATNGKKKTFYLIKSNELRDRALSILVVEVMQFLKKELNVKTVVAYRIPGFSARNFGDMSIGICYPLWNWSDEDIAGFLKIEQ